MKDSSEGPTAMYRAAATLHEQLVSEGLPGVYPDNMPAWVHRTAREAVWAYLKGAATDSEAAEACEQAFRNYIARYD